MNKIAIIMAAGIGAGSLFAQAPEDTRVAEIEAQQLQKAAHVTPVTQNRIERGLIWTRESSLVDRFLSGSGLHPKFGGLGAENGIGLGVGYGWSGRQLSFRTSATASMLGAR